MSAVYLEHYLDSLEHLPIELQRNFTLMRDLDSRAQSIMRNIDKMADDFVNNMKTMSGDRKKETMNEIQAQFNKAKEYGDDKVQLAIQTYELVDKHIRRLDSDLARFESEIQDKALTNTRNSQDEQVAQKRRKKLKEKEKKKKAGGGGVAGGAGGPGGATSDEESTTLAKTAKKKKKGGGKSGASGGNTGASLGANTGSESTGGLMAAVLPTLSHGADVLDMPVDPNEPTYCLCHQVSYGEMIGCDNPDCPIEWFHFACVGLTTKPKGKWFCPKCTADRKKK